MERRLSTTLTSTANLCIPTAHLLPWWPGLDDGHKTNRLRVGVGRGPSARADPDRMPGRPGALLRPAPLRTGLARFPRIRLKQARADLLPQTPYVILGGPPVNSVPVQGFVLRSVHHADIGHRGLRPVSRLRRHGV